MGRNGLGKFSYITRNLEGHTHAQKRPKLSLLADLQAPQKQEVKAKVTL